MLTKQDLENQRESLQQDLLTVLDGLDNTFLTNVCELVVQRFAILLDKLDAS